MKRTLAVISLLVALAAVASCGGKTPPPATIAPEAVAVTPEGAADAAPPREVRTCRSNADCGAAEMCAGPEGCTTAWTCVGMRQCTMDAVMYCGCDGKTRSGSGSCPPAPYKKRGACE